MSFNGNITPENSAAYERARDARLAANQAQMDLDALSPGSSKIMMKSFSALKRLERATEAADSDAFVRRYNALIRRPAGNKALLAKLEASVQTGIEMVKALSVDDEPSCREQVIKAFNNLNERFTKAAAAGLLTAEEGARADVYLAALADRIRQEDAVMSGATPMAKALPR